MHNARSKTRRLSIVGAIGAVVIVAAPATAAAVPPPPPNPSDDEISSSRAHAKDRAGQVGKLTSQLSAAEDKLTKLRDNVQLKQELANKARVNAQTAQQQSDDANAKAAKAHDDANAANAKIESARKGMNAFAASSYRQGSSLGSVSAYVTAKDAKVVLARAQMLDAVGKTRLNALDRMRIARTQKSNADASAKKAAQDAREKSAAADRANKAAAAAQQAAIAASNNQASRTKDLQGDVDRVQKQLWKAQRQVHGLEGQRSKYNQWLAAKKREEALKRRKAALAAAKRAQEQAAQSGGGGGHVAKTGSGSVEDVIARAMKQRGVTYAWGGGTASGPSKGIHDGGVADAYGDYNKVGFDCSGLMTYAFAGAGISLPHYSGYQYNAGQHVPLSQMKRGDMLFYGNGGIHHVTLYLGHGMMIEAEESGTRIHVTPVRYDDILPYATRMIG